MALLTDYFHEEDLKDIWKMIRRRLKDRGYMPIDKSEWEKHGPHQGMEYMVFLGPSKDLTTKQKVEVVLYPRKVYHMGNCTEWFLVGPEDILPLKKSRRR